MKSLVENVKPGDHLVFCCTSFRILICFVSSQLLVSGHGSQIVNTNHTEEDGFDEGRLTLFLKFIA